MKREQLYEKLGLHTNDIAKELSDSIDFYVAALRARDKKIEEFEAYVTRLEDFIRRRRYDKKISEDDRIVGSWGI